MQAHTSKQSTDLTHEKINYHGGTLRALWSSIESVMPLHLGRPTVQIALEWPSSSSCSYWAGGGGVHVGTDHLRHQTHQRSLGTPTPAVLSLDANMVLSHIVDHVRVPSVGRSAACSLTGARRRSGAAPCVSVRHARVEGALPRATRHFPDTLVDMIHAGWGMFCASGESSRVGTCAITPTAHWVFGAVSGSPAHRLCVCATVCRSVPLRGQLSVLPSTPWRPGGHHYQPLPPLPASNEMWANHCGVRERGSFNRSPASPMADCRPGPGEWWTLSCFLPPAPFSTCFWPTCSSGSGTASHAGWRHLGRHKLSISPTAPTSIAALDSHTHTHTHKRAKNRPLHGDIFSDVGIPVDDTNAEIRWTQSVNM